MLQPDTYKEWAGAAWPGSKYEGEWKAGADIRFIGPDGSRTLASLLQVKKPEFILAKHVAVLLPGEWRIAKVKRLRIGWALWKTIRLRKRKV